MNKNDLVSCKQILSEIEKLKQSPWFNNGKNNPDIAQSIAYQARKEAVEIVELLCIRSAKHGD